MKNCINCHGGVEWEQPKVVILHIIQIGRNKQRRHNEYKKYMRQNLKGRGRCHWQRFQTGQLSKSRSFSLATDWNGQTRALPVCQGLLLILTFLMLERNLFYTDEEKFEKPGVRIFFNKAFNSHSVFNSKHLIKALSGNLSAGILFIFSIWQLWHWSTVGSSYNIRGVWQKKGKLPQQKTYPIVTATPTCFPNSHRHKRVGGEYVGRLGHYWVTLGSCLCQPAQTEAAA